MKRSEIKDIISAQEISLQGSASLERDLLSAVSSSVEGFATIISGIRRCGKSTLMLQMMERTQGGRLYLNFDTPKLNAFGMDDFATLQSLCEERGATNLFFDEIQVVEGWEVFVRSMLDAGYQVTVTGSNATMLSRELGSRLTGRHLTKELFPFSLGEYCRFKGLPRSAESLRRYLDEGGFPGYLKTGNAEVLTSLFDDIIYRDVAVRYGIRDAAALKRLLLFLIANIGNLVSGNKMTQPMGIKTAKTVIEYFDYFVQTYIISFLPRFSFSYRQQMVNLKKVYCIDNGLHLAVSPSSQTDLGRRLENMVYGELRRRHAANQLFYYSNAGHECDFLVCDKNQPVALYQVCLELNEDNEERELKGLLQAMEDLHIDTGTMLTLDQEDEIKQEGKRLEVRPVWKIFE